MPQSGDIRKLKEVLPQLVKGARAVYTDLPSRDAPRGPLADFLHPRAAQSPLQALLLQQASGAKARPLAPLVDQLRVVKSDAEVANMRRAGQMSGRAITAAVGRSWGTERSLHAFLDYSFKANGCEEEAYEPVVASDKVGPFLPRRVAR
jgi:intermediate cleaving peptidase 55